MPVPEDRAERSNGENNGFSAVKIAWPDQAIHPWPSYPPDFTLSTSDERRRGKWDGTRVRVSNPDTHFSNVRRHTATIKLIRSFRSEMCF